MPRRNRIALLILTLLLLLGSALLFLRPRIVARAKREGGWAAMRGEMVEATIVARGVTDEAVVQAMRSVPRHQFVPEAYIDQALGHLPCLYCPRIGAFVSWW